jgi:hypothetical protein
VNTVQIIFDRHFGQVHHQMDEIIEMLRQQMATIQDLTAKVSEVGGHVGALVSGVDGLVNVVTNLKAGGNFTPEEQQAIDEAVNALTNASTALQDAVTKANAAVAAEQSTPV